MSERVAAIAEPRDGQRPAIVFMVGHGVFVNPTAFTDIRADQLAILQGGRDARGSFPAQRESAPVVHGIRPRAGATP
jgi:hypothetical protein